MGDILKPDLLWVEGRCYRMNEATTTFNFEEDDLYTMETPYTAEVDCDDYEIHSLDNGKFTTSFHVPLHYCGVIIGKKGLTKKKIETDTMTEIKIPKMGQSGEVTVTGASAGNVQTARRRIDMIVMSARARQKATHFVSIPMNFDNIMDGFNKFKELVLLESESNRVKEDMFIPAAKLHFTICIMCLMDNEERMHASELLTQARATIMSLLDGKPLRIKVKGLSHFMDEDPKELNVLFGEADREHPDTARLQAIADAVYEFFLDKGVAKHDRLKETVKLHMTLINNRYAIKVDETDVQGIKQSFDATRILEQYADYDFGEVVFKEIHLSQMGSESADGYYSATCVVSCTDAGLE